MLQAESFNKLHKVKITLRENPSNCNLQMKYITRVDGTNDILVFF